MNKKTCGLPEQITVGWRTYKIVSLDSAGKAEYAGQADITTGEIRLNPSLDPEILTNTVLHETIHAIAQVWLESKQVPESTTSSLASGLQTVWRDNPKLIEWLNNNIKKLSQ